MSWSFKRMPSTRRLLVVSMLATTASLAGCQTTKVTESGYPMSYSERHPIRLAESATAHEILVGTTRGTMTNVQRTELEAFAGRWRQRATGGVVIETPSGSANELAAAQMAREVKSVLIASGIPAYGITIQAVAPGPKETLPPVRVVYPTVKAETGPCGIWPDDLGVSDADLHSQNRPYWNLGCANQKAFAAMIDNPADLVQPRSQQSGYSPRRQMVVDKYRQGQDSRTQVMDEAKLSTVGK